MKEGAVCSACDLPLEKKPARLKYLKYYFDVELPRCPGCGQVFIEEELVVGKIREVERSLEDK